MATHSSTLAWRILQMEDPCSLWGCKELDHGKVFQMANTERHLVYLG